MTDLRLKLASTLSALKLQISTPRLQCRMLPFFPGSVVEGAGIDITSAGGAFTISWDATEAGFSAFGMQLGAAASAAAARGVLGLTISVKDFGAVGDGTTNDSTAIQAACNACAAAGGGIVWMPPTGAAYICSNISLGNGVHLVGARSRVFPGETASIAQWTASGTWIRSNDTTNPTVTLTGHGSGAIGLNFIRNQVIPGGGAYTPTTFPDEIKVTGTFFTIDDILTVGTTHDIWLAYSSGSGGGSYSRLTNIFSGALIRGLKIDNVNDTMYIENIKHRGLFYESTASLVTYRLANTIGWDCGYFDNPQVSGLEFFHVHTGFLFTDQTCLGNTHSLFNAKFTNVSFNLVRYAMRLAAGTTTVTASFANVVAQSDGSVSDQLFLITSDNIDLDFGILSVPVAGGRVIELGNGSGGKLSIADLDILNYGALDTTASAILANAGSRTRLGTWLIATAASTGANFTGSGIFYGVAEHTLEAGTVSSAATLDIVLTAHRGYRAFCIELESLLPATDGVIPYLRFSTNGGSTYDAGASNYSYAANVTEQGGTNAPYGSGGATEIQMSHPSATVGNAANEGGRWRILLSDPSNSALWTKAQFDGCYIDNSATPRTIDVRGTGHRRAAQDTDAIRVLFSSGNIASGKWRLVGLL